MSETGTVRIHSAHLTDPGMVREENQDACIALRGPVGEQLLLVADGMGGHKGGSTASRILIETVRERFEATPIWDRQLLEGVIVEGNARIYAAAAEDLKLTGMGTTAVAVLFGGKGSDAWVAHVGDSRAYRLREDGLVRLTHDHSTVAELVRRGAITEEEAFVHPRRNEILRSVGVEQSVNVEVAALDVQVGDRIMLCSDGLYGVVRDDQIAEVLRELSPAEAVPNLVAAANTNGGPDNVTVMISALALDNEGLAEAPLGGLDSRRTITIATSVAAALLLAVAIVRIFG